MPKKPPPLANPLAKPIEFVPPGSLAVLRAAAADCTACPLYRHATQTVFGEGAARARVVLIGEQPGAREDETGHPFVGPAGQLLDDLLVEAGLARDTLYVTNAVKHFKWEPRGKVRLHKRANAAEQAACRPWLAAELLRIKPRLVVALGAMAAQAVFGNAFRISRERGQWHDVGFYRAIASWHPSAILRMREPERSAAKAQLLTDLKAVAKTLHAGVPTQAGT
jgi:uracil-DNA glycosylase family protein